MGTPHPCPVLSEDDQDEQNLVMRAGDGRWGANPNSAIWKRLGAGIMVGNVRDGPLPGHPQSPSGLVWDPLPWEPV